MYKAKEDYFAAALSDQSTRFALIISTLLLLLTLVSFTWLKYEKRSLIKRINNFSKEFNDIKADNLKMKSRIYRTTANSYAIIASSLDKQSYYLTAFEFKIFAAYYHLKGVEGEKEDRKEQCYSVSISSLKVANKSIGKISEGLDKHLIHEKKESLINIITEISESDREELKDLCAEVRISFKNIVASYN